MSIIEGFIIFTLVCFCFAAEENKCKEGESYWCQSYDTAAECGVIAFCHGKYPSFRNKKITFAKKSEEASDVKPVKIELYYESFCPGCRAFIKTQLSPTYQKLASTGIMDIGLYPYGNAYEKQVGDKWEFTCQHGEEECQVNQLEACALHMLLHPNQFMPFIECIESAPGLENGEACAEKLHIEWGPISNCYNGTQGNHLMHELALKTGALNPPHKYVPWIVVNGEHTDAIQNAAQTDLMHFVCKTYTGVKPHACRVHESFESKRCYKN